MQRSNNVDDRVLLDHLIGTCEQRWRRAAMRQIKVARAKGRGTRAASRSHLHLHKTHCCLVHARCRRSGVVFSRVRMPFASSGLRLDEGVFLR
jgi:hypothetical protein